MHTGKLVFSQLMEHLNALSMMQIYACFLVKKIG